MLAGKGVVGVREREERGEYGGGGGGGGVGDDDDFLVVVVEDWR